MKERKQQIDRIYKRWLPLAPKVGSTMKCRKYSKLFAKKPKNRINKLLKLFCYFTKKAQKTYRLRETVK
jgi:hypothetical protein